SVPAHLPPTAAPTPAGRSRDRTRTPRARWRLAARRRRLWRGAVTNPWRDGEDTCMASRYDDELWELVPQEPGPPPAELVDFVRSLGHVGRALDLGSGDGRL